MQTFLPYPSYTLSAEVLDNKRLGKQIEEARQIYRIIIGKDKTSGWRHHPAVHMWFPFPYALSLYYNAIREEWVRRGFRTKRKPIKHPIAKTGKRWNNWQKPQWLLEPKDLFCSKHRAALLKKNPTYYSKFGWAEIPKIDYWWPDNPWHRI